MRWARARGITDWFGLRKNQMRNKSSENRAAAAAQSAPVRVPKTTGMLTGMLHSRRVPLRGVLTERSAACCINRMLILAADNKRQPIVVDVETPTGPLRDAVSVIRTMNGVPCPVATFSRGHVGVAGLLIAAHGLKGYRVAHPATHFRVPQGVATAENHDPEAKFWHGVLQILAQDTGKSEEEIANWLKKGLDLDAERAIQLGFVDVLGTSPVFPNSL